MHEGKDEKKCEGVKKNVAKSSIHLDDYKRCLFTRTEELRTMNVIRSRNHHIYTEEINKIALSSTDDKRIICDDKTTHLLMENKK